MLLPHLQGQNRKWTAVKAEHLKRADIAAVKSMQHYLLELLQDAETMRMHLDEEEPEDDPAEEAAGSRCNPDETHEHNGEELQEEEKRDQLDAEEENMPSQEVGGTSPKTKVEEQIETKAVTSQTQPSVRAATASQSSTRKTITVLGKRVLQEGGLDDQDALHVLFGRKREELKRHKGAAQQVVKELRSICVRLDIAQTDDLLRIEDSDSNKSREIKK